MLFLTQNARQGDFERGFGQRNPAYMATKTGGFSNVFDLLLECYMCQGVWAGEVNGA